MTAGRTKAVVKEIGCYADSMYDRDLPVEGPEYVDHRLCMIHFCTPKVSSQTLLCDCLSTCIQYMTVRAQLRT